MERKSERISRTTYSLTPEQVCVALIVYMREEHNVHLPENAIVTFEQDGASIVAEYAEQVSA